MVCDQWDEKIARLMSRPNLSTRLARLAISIKKILHRAGLADRPLVRYGTNLLKTTVFQKLYKPTGPVSEVRLEGLRVRLPSRLIKFYVLKPWEPQTHRRLVDFLRSGMRAVDVGANFGFFTLIAARAVGASGRVISIEPTDSNLELLRANLRLNGLADRVSVLPCAAGRSRRIRSFHLTDATDTHGFYANPLKQTLTVTQVEQRPLDEVVDGSVDLIKVDVEGAEIEVLEGSMELLRRSPEARLIIEWNPLCQQTAGNPPEALPAMLRELGFRLTVLDEHSGCRRSVEETLSLLAGRDLPDWWFGNLWAEPSHVGG